MVDGSTENAFISSLISSQHYIGIRDYWEEGRFEWLDSRSVSFTSWNSGEPNNSGGEDCVEITSGSGLWNDIPCDYARSFVCEDNLGLNPIYHDTDLDQMHDVWEVNEGSACGLDPLVNDSSGDAVDADFTVVDDDDK